MVERGASMDPTTDVKQMRDAVMSRVDEQLAHTYEQIKRADEQLARMENQLSRQGREAIPRSQPRRSRTTPWLRGFLGLLLAAYIIAAALFSQSSYGDVVGRWAPPLVSALTLPKRVVQLAAVEPPAQIATNDAAPMAVAVPPEPSKSLETMARDLANLEREIELLKANQQQLVSDNAKAIEQIQAVQEQAVRDIARNAELLKASQDQVAQLVARASQQSLKPRTPAPQQQAAIGARKPMPTPASLTPASSHAAARPQAPAQLRPDPAQTPR
jgi:uncharacterized protein YoxC